LLGHFADESRNIAAAFSNWSAANWLAACETQARQAALSSFEVLRAGAVLFELLAYALSDTAVAPSARLKVSVESKNRLFIRLSKVRIDCIYKLFGECDSDSAQPMWRCLVAGLYHVLTAHRLPAGRIRNTADLSRSTEL